MLHFALVHNFWRFFPHIMNEIQPHTMHQMNQAFLTETNNKTLSEAHEFANKLYMANGEKINLTHKHRTLKI